MFREKYQFGPVARFKVDKLPDFSSKDNAKQKTVQVRLKTLIEIFLGDAGTVFHSFFSIIFSNKIRLKKF